MTGPALLIAFDPETWTITEVMPVAGSDREELLLLELERNIREALNEYRQEASG